MQFYSTSIPTERIFLHLARLRTKQGILRFGAAATKFSQILILKPGKWFTLKWDFIWSKYTDQIKFSFQINQFPGFEMSKPGNLVAAAPNCNIPCLVLEFVLPCNLSSFLQHKTVQHANKVRRIRWKISQVHIPRTRYCVGNYPYLKSISLVQGKEEKHGKLLLKISAIRYGLFQSRC